MHLLGHFQVNRRGMASAALPILCMAALIQPAHLENLEVGKRGDALYFKAKGNVNDGKMTMDAAMEIGTPKVSCVSVAFFSVKA